MAQLVVGKYKFYPYERDNERTVTLKELEKLLQMSKARTANAGKRKLAVKRRG